MNLQEEFIYKDQTFKVTYYTGTVIGKERSHDSVTEMSHLWLQRDGGKEEELNFEASVSAREGHRVAVIQVEHVASGKLWTTRVLNIDTEKDYTVLHYRNLYGNTVCPSTGRVFLLLGIFLAIGAGGAFLGYLCDVPLLAVLLPLAPIFAAFKYSRETSSGLAKFTNVGYEAEGRLVQRILSEQNV